MRRDGRRDARPRSRRPSGPATRSRSTPPICSPAPRPRPPSLLERANRDAEAIRQEALRERDPTTATDRGHRPVRRTTRCASLADQVDRLERKLAKQRRRLDRIAQPTRPTSAPAPTTGSSGQARSRPTPKRLDSTSAGDAAEVIASAEREAAEIRRAARRDREQLPRRARRHCSAASPRSSTTTDERRRPTLDPA